MSSEREKILAVMTEYGHIDEKYLTDTYWERLAEGIEKYGAAKRILALEYHGDDYSMYGGAYSLTPKHFEEQMRYLMNNDYHFVTGPELAGFVEGWLDLPARSIILTTDSGNASYKSLPRITALFKKLEAEYGFTPHMLPLIWTKDMAEGESQLCDGDACWNLFRDVLKSGYFTLGSHSESHDDFSTFSMEEGIADLTQSKAEIKAALGINVYFISWPFEVCFRYVPELREAGFRFAYGGTSRGLGTAHTYKNDPIPMCLPRLLPPNPNGLSGRPNGWTLEEMLNYTINNYQELKK